MASIKIRRRHIRYLILAFLFGTIQLYRSLDHEAIPVVPGAYSSINFVVNKSSGLISSSGEVEEETFESHGSEELIGSNNTSKSGSFSLQTFSPTISPCTPQNSHISNDAAHAGLTSIDVGGSQSSGTADFTPIQENKKNAPLSNFTKPYSIGNKFSSVGLSFGGEEVLGVPPPPPVPDETPLDSISFLILLIGLGIGSYTIQKSKVDKCPAKNTR